MNEEIQDPRQPVSADPFTFQSGPEWYQTMRGKPAPDINSAGFKFKKMFGLATPDELQHEAEYDTLEKLYYADMSNRAAHKTAFAAKVREDARTAPEVGQLDADRYKAVYPTLPMTPVQGPGAPTRSPQAQEPLVSGLKAPVPYEAPDLSQQGLVFRGMTPSNVGATQGPQLMPRPGVTSLNQKVSPYGQALLKEESVKNIYQAKQEEVSAENASKMIKATTGLDIAPTALPPFMKGADVRSMITGLGRVAQPDEIRQAYKAAGIKMPDGADAAPMNEATLRSTIDLLGKAGGPHAVDLETRLATTMAPDVKSFDQLSGRVVTPADKARWDSSNQFPDSKVGETFQVALDGEVWRREQLKTKLYAQNRIDAEMRSPEEVGKRQNAVSLPDLRQGRIVHAPRGISKGDLRKGEYVEMTDKQLSEWKELNKTNAAAEVMFDFADNLATATTPWESGKEFLRLWGGAMSKSNTVAATYADAKEAWSSDMARAYGGEVGVMTNPDILRWEKTLYRFGDTVEIKEYKKELFRKIYDIARKSQIAMLAGDLSPEEARAQVKTAMADIGPQADAIAKASEENERLAKSGGKDAAKAQEIFQDLTNKGVLQSAPPEQRPLTLPGQTMDETTPFNPGARPAPIDPSQIQRPQGQATEALQSPPELQPELQPPAAQFDPGARPAPIDPSQVQRPSGQVYPAPTQPEAPSTGMNEAGAGALPPIATLARQTRLAQDFRDRVEPVDFHMLKDSYDIYRTDHNLKSLKADVHSVLDGYYDGQELADAERGLLNMMLRMKDFPMKPPPSSRKGGGRKKKKG